MVIDAPYESGTVQKSECNMKIAQFAMKISVFTNCIILLTQGSASDWHDH